MSSRVSSPAKSVLNVTVSLGVLGLGIGWADAGAVIDQLRGASVSWLVWAVAALTLVTVLMAKRWQIVARAFDIDIYLARAIAEYYIAQLVNLVLPGGVAGDVTRAVRARHGADLSRAARSVATERIMGQAVMFGLLGIGLLTAWIVPGGITWPSTTWVAVLAGMSVIGVIAVLCVMPPGRADATRRFLRLTVRLFAQPHLVLLSLIIAMLLIFSLYACARATGTTIPAAGWLTLVPLILSAMLIPLSVGGWGWREGAAAALFPLIGATPSAGIATGIAYGATMMIAALPGLIFAWRSHAAPTFSPQN